MMLFLQFLKISEFPDVRAELRRGPSSVRGIFFSPAQAEVIIAHPSPFGKPFPTNFSESFSILRRIYN